ncbi:antitoxin Xre/MbcA/ParS toxin-binding domain-containing protein [Geminicoccaceae bacterium 1502E]|nr:antitoxin Xre/MbcA/ParS toxin-binding domain-containing protein [Geminicoccaceae bacterium 1502E]
MARSITPADVLGGEAAVGRPIGGWSELMRAAQHGLPIKTIQFVIASERLSPAEIDRVVLRRKTLAHRKIAGPLTPHESGRLVRVARIIAMSETTFGSKAKAGDWLRRPTSALDGEAPLNLLDTGDGARQVEDLLKRIDHGLTA